MFALRQLQKIPWLPDLLSLAGFALWAAALWQAGHRQASVLDEGLYLYKGWLLASGQYVPFQDNGLWMNQMPLAFLIPGWGQVLLGQGLGSGRTLAFLLAMVMLLAVWWTARRVGNRWLAAGVVWAYAINPAAARMYGVAASQGLAACLLALTLLLTLREQPRAWQVFLGGLLAGALVMVRINLLPLLPLFLLYLFWAHGWRFALWALAGMLVSFGGVHLAYWPNILRLWVRWLPLSQFIPWLAQFDAPPQIPTWNPEPVIGFKVASLFLAFRYYFVGLVGAVLAWLLWPKTWKTNWHFKTAVFLSVLLASFFALHAWAALGNDYCTFCFPTYTSFYISVGILLLAVAGPALQLRIPAWRGVASSIILLGLLAGVGYTAVDAFPAFFGENLYREMLSLPVPRLRDGGLAEGQVQLWQLLSSRFGWEYEDLQRFLLLNFPVVAFVIFGLVVWLAGWLLNRASGRGWASGLLAVFGVASLLTPTLFLSDDFRAYDCQPDAIANYETLGSQLAGAISPGSRVYWGGYSPSALLYLPGIEVYPAQLHGGYSFRISDDSAALQRYGWWNETLRQQWLAEADYLIFEQAGLRDETLAAQLAQSAYEQVLVTTPANLCEPASALVVFRRK